MLELLALLIPMALVDSLSVLPVAVFPMILLVGGRRPIIGSLAFLAGLFLTYFPFGVLLFYGLDALFDSLAHHFVAWWYREPDLGEIWLQILLGLIMIMYGRRLCEQSRKRAPRTGRRRDLSMGQAFSLGALINLTGMWGALPYFAAIARILQEDLSPVGMLIALLSYNLAFLLPLAVFPLLRLVLGARSEPLFAAAGEAIVRWGGRLLTILLIGLGFLLVVDGVGWLYGRPLLDPGAASQQVQLKRGDGQGALPADSQEKGKTTIFSWRHGSGVFDTVVGWK